MVILPAFGATLEEMQLLDDRGVTTVDTVSATFRLGLSHSLCIGVESIATLKHPPPWNSPPPQPRIQTCPWVSKVWNVVDKHKKADMTSVIHGKYSHEESIATASFCEDYIIVKDIDEVSSRDLI